MKPLSLEYLIANGLSFSEACTTLEAISSCAIENPACAKKETIDAVIKHIKEEIDGQSRKPASKKGV
jgi:hypothetical protein